MRNTEDGRLAGFYFGLWEFRSLVPGAVYFAFLRGCT